MAFTLHIFESEFNEIDGFVSKYPNIETGGDLFGLWKANGDPVVQLIIGPGQKCRRTSVSFHQDTNYLARVGTYVNSSFMLCHIGSWHSHHQLSLTQPSAGDRSTVCNNFPEGLKRYIMIIANITRGGSSRQSVVIHPYMFSNGGHVCQPGSVRKISLSSPFRELGYVMSCIANGAEQRVSADEAYSSRAPPEYHNRPSTRAKPITGAVGRTNSEVKKPMHQNYFSTNDTSQRHSPMDVDPLKNSAYNASRYQIHGYNETNYQHKASPTRRVLDRDMNGVLQWYETEEGGTLLKDIVEEITTTMSKDINYYRDPHSKDLTMEFTHYRRTWIIHFPKSFDKDPAQVSNSSDRKDVSSKSITKDIRKACKCHQCQNNEHIEQEHLPLIKNHCSPPKEDQSYSYAKQGAPTSSPNSPPPLHHVRHNFSRHGHRSPPDKRPQSERRLKSSLQPWYNTSDGKATVDEIKASIEHHLKTNSNAGRVRTTETINSQGVKVKQLTFYHSECDWIIEFVSSSHDVEMKTEKHRQKRFVAKLSAPYDVVSALIKNCVCSKCRSMRSQSAAAQRRQGSALRRPASRHGVNVTPRSPSGVSSTPKFFSSEEGQTKFGRIYTDITNLLLNGRGDANISRNTVSENINVTFRHGRREWIVTFPFKFPKVVPKVHHSYGNGQREVTLSGGDVLRTIKQNCDCLWCRRHR